jgi:hypothetical protein
MQELLGDPAIAEKLRKPVVVARNKILREWEAAAEAATAVRGAASLPPPTPSPLAAASASLPSPASPPSTAVAKPEPAPAKMQAAATEAGAMRAAKHDGIEPQPQTMAPVPQPQMMTTSPSNALAAALQGNSQDQQPIQTLTATPTHQLGAIDQSVDVSSQVTSTAAQQSGGADTAAPTPPPAAAVDQSVEVAGGAGPVSSFEGTVTAAQPATGTHGSPNTRERAQNDRRERAEYDRIARALSCAQTPSAASATGDVAARLTKSSTSAYGYAAGTAKREGYQVTEPQPQTAMAPAPVPQPPMWAPQPQKVGSATHLSLQQPFIAQDGSQRDAAPARWRRYKQMMAIGGLAAAATLLAVMTVVPSAGTSPTPGPAPIPGPAPTPTPTPMPTTCDCYLKCGVDDKSATVTRAQNSHGKCTVSLTDGSCHLCARKCTQDQGCAPGQPDSQIDGFPSDAPQWLTQWWLRAWSVPFDIDNAYMASAQCMEQVEQCQNDCCAQSPKMACCQESHSYPPQPPPPPSCVQPTLDAVHASIPPQLCTAFNTLVNDFKGAFGGCSSQFEANGVSSAGHHNNQIHKPMACLPSCQAALDCKYGDFSKFLGSLPNLPATIKHSQLALLSCFLPREVIGYFGWANECTIPQPPIPTPVGV